MATLKVTNIRNESFTGTTQLKLDSSGRLLLGTDTVGEATADDLTISTSGSTGITIRSGTGNAGNIQFGDGTSGDDQLRGIIQYHHSDNSLRFGTNASEKLRITSAGNVGIGTTSPTSLLEVVGTTGANVLINAATHDAGTANQARLQLGYVHSGGQALAHLKLDEAANNSFDGILRIGVPYNNGSGGSTTREVIEADFNGNICIPGSTVTFDTTARTNGIQLYYETDQGIATIGSYSSGGNTTLNFITNSGGGAASTGMTINPDGNIGIGTSSPNVGSHNKALTISNTASGARTALEVIGNTANCHAAIDFKSNTTLVSAINSRGTDRLQFCTGSSGSVKAEVTGDNFKIEDGNLIIGTAGHGIDFSDTAGSGTSELFHDYEEGTWTPTAVNFTLGTLNSAHYTKIGNVVYIQCYFSTASGSSGAAFSIGGLPFTVKSGTYYSYACGRMGSGGNTNSASDIVYEFVNASTNIVPLVQDGGMNWGMASNTHIIFSGFYHV